MLQIFTEATGQPRDVVAGWHDGKSDYWFDARDSIKALARELIPSLARLFKDPALFQAVLREVSQQPVP
jgi:hypothetical protein